MVPRLPQLSPARPSPPKEPPGLGRSKEDLLAEQLPPIGLPDFPKGAAPEGSGQKPALEPVRPTETPPSQAQLQLPSIASPGRGTDDILRGLARRRAEGGQGVTGGFEDASPGDSNFSIPGPTLLTDPMGVDFHPYLLRVYLIVRRNWYSVIPEIARLGKQGKVALQFSVLKNGVVPDLVLVSGSGTDSLDIAALASIRLSNPFPPLPAEFPGDNIRLQFVYLYNLPWNY
ncbi:MAG: TonB family protein [Acidobacteria bacterium]|nr:TonB family protein [Acidobacteriota bacterium]